MYLGLLEELKITLDTPFGINAGGLKRRKDFWENDNLGDN